MTGIPHREVLIVDDNDSDREAVIHALRADRSCRYLFHQAATGKQALDIVREHRDQIDLIILDWRLPDLTGIELAELLRGENQIPPYPIVLVTSSGSTELAQDALLVGVQDFFTKSMVRGDILPLVIRNAIERFRLIERLVLSEKEAREAKLRAEDASRTKSMFLTSMSHELRTPLTAVLGLAELLLDDPAACDAKQMLEMIQANGQHLAELLNDILDLAKIEAGHSDITLVPCEPLRIINELCTLLRFRAADDGIDLRLHFRGPLPQQATTDAIRLRQIIMNLLTNAIKFTRGGSIDVFVSFDAAPDPPELCIAVTDTGIGIAPEDLAVIFQPFVQVAEKSAHRSGVGLGLAISRSLARALGGDLCVESKLGVGSTFKLTVAAHHSDHIVETTPAEIERETQKPRPRLDRVATDWSNRRILVAEDTRANQFLIRRMLETTGASLKFVDNGERAVEEALRGDDSCAPYDLILMDMQMPVLSGYDAASAIRAAGRSVPIIALTAAAMQGDRERCLSAGCNSYLSKPISREDLLRMIAAALEDHNNSLTGGLLSPRTSPRNDEVNQ
ncbi:MAG: response regulator [Pirellulales bacterium]